MAAANAQQGKSQNLRQKLRRNASESNPRPLRVLPPLPAL